MSASDRVLGVRLEALARQNRLRPRVGSLSKTAAVEPAMLNASSNDYLGLANVSRETTPLGAGASRLVRGTHSAHLRVEAELSQWLGSEACLLFTSGFAANVGVIAALAAAGDRILSDSLNHASLIDGCRLAAGTTQIVPHGQLGALKAALAAPHVSGHTWVVFESYYSMNADSPPLAEVAAVVAAAGATLIVDEAHALGTFGPKGRGLCAAAGVVPGVLIGTFGKAFGLQGAFVSGSHVLMDYLWNAARTFVFSTAMSPYLATAIGQRLSVVQSADAARASLATKGQRLAERLQAAGVPLAEGQHGPIFPVLFGSEGAAERASELLAAAGVVAQSIRPPTVPVGESRVRITLSALHTEAQVDKIGSALVDCVAVLKSEGYL